jgi:hypothetical protein
LRRNRRLGKPHRVLHDSIVRAWGVINCNGKETKMGAGQWARDLWVCEKCGLGERGGEGCFSGVIHSLVGFRALLRPVESADPRVRGRGMPQTSARIVFRSRNGNRCGEESAGRETRATAGQETGATTTPDRLRRRPPRRGRQCTGREPRTTTGLEPGATTGLEWLRKNLLGGFWGLGKLPQGLKPRLFRGLIGTTEVVP